MQCPIHKIEMHQIFNDVVSCRDDDCVFVNPVRFHRHRDRINGTIAVSVQTDYDGRTWGQHVYSGGGMADDTKLVEEWIPEARRVVLRLLADRIAAKEDFNVDNE